MAVAEFSKRSFFIGCSTEKNFVEPTAVMLSSVDVNGNVPDATVIVASFGIDERDRQLIRTGAGRLGKHLCFLDVSREMLLDVKLDKFTEEYPPAVLGRLLIADQIFEANARLLTLDSDMIVNTSLRPLLELDLGNEFFAAIHDPPKTDDLNYFNSGLTLVDVSMYKFHNIARRCLRYIAEHQPHFPDQDSLNEVVGNSWYRLNPLWNYFYSGNRSFTADDYESAKVVHFCGWKPWDYSNHPAAPLYNRHLAVYRAKVDAILPLGMAARSFIANCYELLLGRELESLAVVAERGRWPRSAILHSIVHSREFVDNILRALTDEDWPQGRFSAPPRLSQRLWAADNLPLRDGTKEELHAMTAWRTILTLILSDSVFRAEAKFQHTIDGTT